MVQPETQALHPDGPHYPNDSAALDHAMNTQARVLQDLTELKEFQIRLMELEQQNQRGILESSVRRTDKIGPEQDRQTVTNTLRRRLSH